MRKTLTYILFTILFVSCNNSQSKQVEASYSDNVTVIESDDITMNKAITKAKNSFSDFDTAFKNGHFDTSEFFIKVRFDVDVGGEHIWIGSIVFENDQYYGTVTEDAEATDKIKQGDRVLINADNLTDWMYNDKGILRGGYTIKVLRNKMTPEERASFDSSFYLQIID